MIDDYEQRFQCSLQKLTIPSWYIDPASLPKISNKPLITPSRHYNREVHRTPEIVHVPRPQSYRSYRSSAGTSPSPSAHSWHPAHMMDGTNLSFLLPSSSSTSRRHNKHQKGIERVTKSSHWYRPTQFISETKNDQISTPTSQSEQCNLTHYDPLKYPGIEKKLRSDQNIALGINLQRKINDLIADVENTSICMRNNDNMTNKLLTNDKQHDHRINLNGSQMMPLANEKTSFARVELEEVTDEEENDKRLSTNKINIPSTVEEIDVDDTNILLERIATNLVDSVLNEALHWTTFEYGNDDTEIGVRELSDDENALRELDENDMSGTDEFIVFSTNAEVSDDEHHNNQTSPTITRGSCNRLYTFSRTNDDNINHSKFSSNQDSPTSTLMIVDKQDSTANSRFHTNPNHSVYTKTSLEQDHESNNSLPIYRSHIQKRHINVGRYYDGMMRGTTSQLPTHDLRCNLVHPQCTSDGVNEETVRKARLLLDSIPNSIDFKKETNENVQNQSIPVRSILKSTRFALSDETNKNTNDEHILRIEEKEEILPKKVISTVITEEYHRIQRQIIEELDEGIITTGSNEEIYRDSDYSSNQESHHTQASTAPSISINDPSPYEHLSECYSGYLHIQNDFLKPTISPFISNVSSLQSTTDEAYESEPTTTSPRSPTMSSSTATTMHIHPELEHEFEYPSPPPPVPDRRLKPSHLRPPPPPPPPPKPRTLKHQQKDLIDYNNSKPIPLVAIQHLLAATSNDSTSFLTRTLSSRHYCGSIPQSNETTTSPTKTKIDEITRKNSKTLNGSNPSTNMDSNPPITFRKSSSSSLSKLKPKKSSVLFDEATNGLAIRLPAPMPDEQDSNNKQEINRTPPTPSSIERTEETTKTPLTSGNLVSDRSSVYETSV